jgi:uncharacterized BrkB/YihY/UPF0761 family membrane protein
MPQSMKVGLVLLLVVGMLGVVQPAWGQDVTASIVGTVTDPSGAPIKDAAVTATNTERGTVYTTRTSEVGSYNVRWEPTL